MNRDDRDQPEAPQRDRDAERDDTRPDAGQRTAPPMGGYQEGNVESVGGGPSGTDAEDRTGQVGSAPEVPRPPVAEGNRDIFISSEVAAQSADAPGGRPERTRS